MSILLGLTPFIVFFLLMRWSTPLLALTGAAAMSAILMGRMALSGGTIKILEIGSLILFALLTLYTLGMHPGWSIAGVRLAVDAGLAFIVLFSLAIRRPFTLQYAKESVPEQFWTHPLFIRTNDIISAVWAVTFLISAGCDAVAIYFPTVPVGALIALTVAAFVAAIWFSTWYPAQVRRSFRRAAGAPG
jgi:hypothetical protein